MGLLPDTQNFGLRMRRECRERFPRLRGLTILKCITDVRDARAEMHVRLTNFLFLMKSVAEKSPRHSRCMHNPQFYVTGKRPMEFTEDDLMRQAHDVNFGYYEPPKT